jgi:hypothetical protein
VAELPKVLALGGYPNVAIKLTGACALAYDPFPYREIWNSPAGSSAPLAWTAACGAPTGHASVRLLTYAEGADAFHLPDRLSDGDRAKLMGGTLSGIYNWSPSKA